MLRVVGVFVAFILGASIASANGLFDPEEETLRVPALEAEATAPSNMRPTDLNWPARFCAYDGKLYSVGARICVNAHLMLACQREDSRGTREKARRRYFPGVSWFHSSTLS